MPCRPSLGEGSPTKIDYRGKQRRKKAEYMYSNLSTGKPSINSGDIPNSMRCALCSHHPAALAEPRGTLGGTLVEPSWNPRGTSPQARPGPPQSLSGLRPQSFQLLGKKLVRFLGLRQANSTATRTFHGQTRAVARDSSGVSSCHVSPSRSSFARLRKAEAERADATTLLKHRWLDGALEPNRILRPFSSICVNEYFVVFRVGVKGNLSLLEVFFIFPRGLKQMEVFIPPGYQGPQGKRITRPSS